MRELRLREAEEFAQNHHVRMWELDHKAGWAPKNRCFQIVVLERTPESPLDSKEMKPGDSKGNQPWLFIGRTDAEAEAPLLWPPDVKSWLTGKDPDAVKDWRQEEKGTTEDEMVGWHHRLNGRDFEQAPGVGDGQGSLVCYSPWSQKESDTTEWLDWTDLIFPIPPIRGQGDVTEGRGIGVKEEGEGGRKERGMEWDRNKCVLNAF